MTSSKPNYLPKAPSPNAVTSGVMGSTCEFGGGGNTIQSVTVMHKRNEAPVFTELTFSLYIKTKKQNNVNNFR